MQSAYEAANRSKYPWKSHCKLRGSSLLTIAALPRGSGRGQDAPCPLGQAGALNIFIRQGRCRRKVSNYSFMVLGKGASDSLGSAPRPTPPPVRTGEYVVLRTYRICRSRGMIPAQWGCANRRLILPPQDSRIRAAPWARSQSVKSLSSDARQNPKVVRHSRGPRSTWRQSTGIPDSKTGPPPPHRSPLMSVMRPHVAFMKFVGMKPSEMSTPVAGQLRWVLNSSRAVGRP